MNKKIIISALVLAALVVATVFGVLIYNTASASGQVQRWQNMPGAYVSGAFQAGPDQFGDRGPGRPGDRDGASQEQLASALGITTDELTAAYEKANQAALDKAVAEGLITQAQADELTQNSGADVFPFGGRWQGWLSQKGIDYDALLADALGISTDELNAARQKAQEAALDQAVADGRLTQEQADLMKARQALYGNTKFQSAMQTAFEDAVKQAVSDGVITQAQADALLAEKAAMGDRGGFGGMFGGHGGRGGHGGPGGRGGFGPGDQSTTPSATQQPAASPQG